MVQFGYLTPADKPMHEILSTLSDASRVLDLGAASGSFSASSTRAAVVRFDLIRPLVQGDAPAVLGDASRLPFADRVFDAVVANHSLEHIVNLDSALREIGRVVRPGGCFFVSVPDASTITDRIYRWMARGGGHVNPFTDPALLARSIEAATGLPFAQGRTLHTSLSFLNKRNAVTPLPRRSLFVGGGNESFLRILTLVLRKLDIRFGWRLSVYGWALYFGAVSRIDTEAWPNVCVRCGSAGKPEPRNLKPGIPARRWCCPTCRATNYFTGPVPSRDVFR